RWPPRHRRSRPSGAPSSPGMSREVKARRTAVIAGVAVAICVLAMFGQRRLPDAIITLLGGPRAGVVREGGVTIRYQPPQGEARILEVAGVAESQADEAIQDIVGGGLTMHVVRAGDLADDIARLTDTRVEVDRWTDEAGGQHVAPYLQAESRQELESVIARAVARGWEVPRGTELRFERIEPEGKPPSWRSHELVADAVIDGSMIASSWSSQDPNTGRPIVIVEFTDAGAEVFCEVTREIVGSKLAIVVGGRVRSAPVINGEICGGK